MRLPLILLFALVTACGGSNPSSSSGGAPPTGDGGAGGGVDGSTDAAAAGGDGSTPAIAACEGKTSDAILGTWTATALAGGDGPNGIVNVKTAHHFCGTTSSGTTRFTEDGPGFGGKGCKLVTDIRGTFTLDGETLVITNQSGFRSLRGCESGTDQEGKLESTDTRSYKATITATQLTLTSTDPNGGSPQTFTRE